MRQAKTNAMLDCSCSGKYIAFSVGGTCGFDGALKSRYPLHRYLLTLLHIILVLAVYHTGIWPCRIVQEHGIYSFSMCNPRCSSTSAVCALHRKLIFPLIYIQHSQCRCLLERQTLPSQTARQRYRLQVQRDSAMERRRNFMPVDEG